MQMAWSTLFVELRFAKLGEFNVANQLAIYYMDTLPETNITPENRLSQKEIHLPNHPFLDAMLVSGRVINQLLPHEMF